MRYLSYNPRPYEAHRLAVDLVKPHSRVLDLGCATGYIACELQKKDCQVFGVEQDPEAAKLARRFCKKVVVADLEDSDAIPLPAKYFDYVVLLDVLEHLRNGEQLLTLIHNWLVRRGTLIISTPNVAHISIRLNLLQGKFIYEDYGILDKTHIHLFTKATLISLLEITGYKVDRLLATTDFGQLPYVGRIARRIPKQLQFRLTQMFPELLGIQFMAVCHSLRNA